MYFGLGTTNFTNAYLTEAGGKAQYKVGDERGTILKVAPDFSRREIVCTGIRFPVGMAFNDLGDLFATDQEGATWLPNGNPFDEPTRAGNPNLGTRLSLGKWAIRDSNP